MIAIILPILLASVQCVKIEGAETSTLPTESLFTYLKSGLLAIGTFLLAFFSVQAVRDLFAALTVTVYSRAEPHVKKVGWRTKMCLLVGGGCLVAWGVMAAVGAVAQLALMGIFAVGAFLVIKERMRDSELFAMSMASAVGADTV